MLWFKQWATEGEFHKPEVLYEVLLPWLGGSVNEEDVRLHKPCRWGRVAILTYI